MQKLFLLDAYALIYRAYYAFIRNPRINSKGENTSAILGFVNTLEQVLRKEKPDYIGVAFDPAGGTFRHEIYPEYKAQREETPEGIRFAIPYIKKILEAYNIPIIEVPGYEADDVIGTLAWRFSKAEEEAEEKENSSDEMGVFMISPDKDYGQLVRRGVWMVKPKSGGDEFEVMGPKEICEKWGIDSTLQVIDILGLMGDAADNIPGCPGVGEKTAVKLVNQFSSVESMFLRTDELKGALKKKIEEHVEDIRFSKMLATIKTDVPCSITLDELRLSEKNAEQLRSLFDELELRNLAHRVLGGEEPQSPTLTLAASEGNSSKTRKQKKLEAATAGMGDLFSGMMGGSANTTENVNNSENSSVENELFTSNGAETEFGAILTAIETYPHEYYLVDTEDEMRRISAKFLSGNLIALDTETTSTDANCAELVGLSFSAQEKEAYYIPIPENREEAQKILEIFRPVYESHTILKIGQNIKYDITVLASYGIEVQGPMFDTMIAHYVLHPELHHGMDYLAEVYLKYKTIHIDQLIGARGKNQKSMRDLNPTEVYEYAAEDAEVTLRLYNILKPELEASGSAPLFYDIEMPLVPVLSRMERNGVCLDTESLKQTSAEFSQRMNDIEREVYELSGEQFNISSPRQVGEILFGKLRIIDKPKKTKTGQFVTSEDVLQNLRQKHPVVEKILEYRGYKKLLSTYIDALPSLINPKSGHIHTSYNQAVTTTGRLSSSNPNLQNIPIRDANGKEVRKAFIPEPGCEFFSADYSQIELRLMAHLSGDEAMIEAFNSGHDIHQATAAKVYHLPLEEVTSDLRRKAKTANFGIIYGISAFGLAERMEVSRSEAKELIDGYFATYPRIKAYMDESIAKARELGYTETLFGRRCYLPDINSHNATVRGYAERNAINSPIQGTAADIIKLAMVRIDERMRREGLQSKMILQVHDELNFSVYPTEREQLQRLVIEEMQAVVSLSVPLIADCGWGVNWLEAH